VHLTTAGEDEGGPSAFVMRELLREDAPFQMLIQTGQVRSCLAWHGDSFGRSWRVVIPLVQNAVGMNPWCKAGSSSKRMVVSASPQPKAPLFSPPQVLLGERQFQEARELLQAALDVCGKR
jgi:hypothetical protein